jgi:hypothetical protein
LLIVFGLSPNARETQRAAIAPGDSAAYMPLPDELLLDDSTCMLVVELVLLPCDDR